jgi:hypothetical protein
MIPILMAYNQSSLATVLQLNMGTRSSKRECSIMRHQQVRDYHLFARETVRRLPDGRRLVTDLDRPAKVIDLEGNEFAPSPSEVTALLALAGMTFPRKKADGKRLLRLERDEDDWLLAG